MTFSLVDTKAESLLSVVMCGIVIKNIIIPVLNGIKSLTNQDVLIKLIATLMFIMTPKELCPNVVGWELIAPMIKIAIKTMVLNVGIHGRQKMVFQEILNAF